jgi:hypothetical protein
VLVGVREIAAHRYPEAFLRALATQPDRHFRFELVEGTEPSA